MFGIFVEQGFSLCIANFQKFPLGVVIFYFYLFIYLFFYNLSFFNLLILYYLSLFYGFVGVFEGVHESMFQRMKIPRQRNENVTLIDGAGRQARLKLCNREV